MKRIGFLVFVVFLFVSAGLAWAEVAFDAILSFGGLGIGREVFDRPVDVAEDREENIYVVDQRNSRIQVLDRRGRYLREWGSRGFQQKYFENPSAIALDSSSGSLYVADTGNHRIQKFDTKGNFLLAFGRLGSRDSDLNSPRDLAIDRKGNLYVADTGNHRVKKFSPSGKLIQEWGKFSRRRGNELNYPVSLAYSDEGFGYILVLDGQTCEIQKYDIDGSLEKEWPMRRKGEAGPCGSSRIRIEPRRYTVYIADTENDRILLFGKNGEELGEFKGEKIPFLKPGGVSVADPFEESVLVADTGNNRIHKFRRVR